jgi:hypothetical protein
MYIQYFAFHILIFTLIFRVDRPSDKHSDRSKTEKVKARLHIFKHFYCEMFILRALYGLVEVPVPDFKPSYIGVFVQDSRLKSCVIVADLYCFD